MSLTRSRILAAALLGGLLNMGPTLSDFGFMERERGPAPPVPRPRRRRKGRVGFRPAAPYLQAAPKVGGVRMMWVKGKLVPRHEVLAGAHR